MLLGSSKSDIVVVTEQSVNGVTPFNEIEGKLFKNIFEFYGIELFSLLITSAIDIANITPNKTNLYRHCYKGLHTVLTAKSFKRVLLFTNLLDKFVIGDELRLPYPDEVKKRTYSVTVNVPCLTLPTITELLKDDKLEKGGKKHQVYVALKGVF
jgi:hypothetical protein